MSARTSAGSVWLGLGLLGAGCTADPASIPQVGSVSGGSTPTSTVSTSTPACPDGTALDWDSFAHPFFVGYCTSCHSSLLTGILRGGAPEAVNLDSYDAVSANAVRVRVTATGPTPTMPPGGGPSDEARVRLLEWLDCGLPGPPDPIPPAACDAPVLDGSAVLNSDADVAEFCAAWSGVTGALTLGVGGDLDCVCTVGGDLTVATPDTELTLPNLASVGGALSVVDNGSLVVFEAPALASAGAVAFARDRALVRIDVASLTDVPGAFAVEDDGFGGALTLDHLATVGDLRLVGLPRLTALTLFRLDAVTGSIEVDDVGATAIDLGPVRTIGGGVRIADAPALVDLDGLRLVTSVGGGITVEDAPALGSLATFNVLASVGGSITLGDLPALATFTGFDLLATVGGGFTLSGTALTAVPSMPYLQAVGPVAVVDNPVIDRLGAFGAPTAVVGGLTVSGNAALGRIDPLGWGRVAGPVEVCDSPALETLSGFDGVTEIDGDLTVCRNDLLKNAFGLSGLAHIAGDYTVRDNPRLPTAAVTRVAQSATIDGRVRIDGNR